MAATDTLTDKAIRKALKDAATAGKPNRVSDGGGLYFEARPNGAGWWRWRFWRDGREGLLSLGTYPEVSLALARTRRNEARAKQAAGVDPSEDRKAEKARKRLFKQTEELRAAGKPLPGSFESAARAWHAKASLGWSPGHSEKVLALLERDLIPFIGAASLADLTPPDLLREARRIEARGAQETAYRAVKVAGMVFRHGVAEGLCLSDPTRDLRGAVTLPVAKHRAAITDPVKLGELLRAIDGYQGTPVVRAALALAPLVMLRPGELRHAEWSEFDLDAALWSIPPSRMKGRLDAKLNGRPHLVPLATQAVSLLRELHPLTGAGRYVFPNPLTPERPLSDNGVLSALRRMGFAKDEMTGHGFRATARTIAVEVLGIDEAVIEAQLGHRVRDANGRAYNRTQFMAHRRAAMQRWADYLDQLRDGGKVIPMRAA